MPRRIALITGISRYHPDTGLGNLAAPGQDAQRVYEVLARHGEFDHLYPLPLAQGKVGEGGVVAQVELITQLKELFPATLNEPVELALFYFSGHGVFHGGLTGQSYLSCSDRADAVPLLELVNLIKNSAVENVCVWLDCCCSGDLVEFGAFESKGFCLVAAASRAGEALAADGRSLLTEVLCAGLAPHAADMRQVTTLGLLDYVSKHRQNLPQHIAFQYGNTPFVLTRAGAEAAPTEARYPADYRPYKGLAPFETRDAAFFFGRDGFIQQVLDAIAASPFSAVLGASGSGKSSLLKAGVVPNLRDWVIVEMKPGTHPLQRLRDALVRAFPGSDIGEICTAADVLRYLPASATGGGRVPNGESSASSRGLRSESATRGGRVPNGESSASSRGLLLLLFIDQFEELFTECQDESRRQAFLTCILNPTGFHTVITLRADFLGHCAEYPDLARALANHVLLAAPDAAGLRAAITQPLALVGMDMDAGLADRLVGESLYEKGSLPLLQYALDNLWQAARARGVTRLSAALDDDLGASGREGVGGLRALLNQKADDFYQRLPAAEQTLLQWLLVELTQAGENREDTRKTVAVADFYARQPQHQAAIERLLDRLTREERLLTGDQNSAGEAVVTIAHEALLRDWFFLADWLKNSAEVKQWRAGIAGDLAAWQAGSADNLLRGARLAEAERMLEKYPDSLLIGVPERDFIRAGIRRREMEAQRRRTRVRQAFAALLVGFAVISGFAMWGWYAENKARFEQKQRTISLFNSKLTHAGLLTAQEDYAQAGEVLGQTYPLDAEIKENRRHARNLLASVTEILGGRADKVYEGADAALSGGLALSPDGRFLAAAGERATLVLFNTESGKLLRRLEGHDAKASQSGDVRSVVFDPQNRWLFSGGDDKKIIRWSLPDGEKLDEWDAPAGVMALALSPDGGILASGGQDREITLWEVAPEPAPRRGGDGETAAPRQVLRLEGHTDAIAAPNGLAFSPDGSRLASASFDNTSRVWDVTTGKTLHVLEWHKDIVDGVAFSPDGKLIATSSVDQRIVLWDADSGRPVRLLTGHQNIVFGVTFLDDGRTLASASRDNTLRLWDVDSGVTLRVLQGHSAGLWDVAARGDFLYSAADDGTVRRWPLAELVEAASRPASSPPLEKGGKGGFSKGRLLENPPQSPFSKGGGVGQWLWNLGREPASAAVSSDGGRVAVGFADGSLRVYGLPCVQAKPDRFLATCQVFGNGDAPEPLVEMAEAHGTMIIRLAFSPDGKLLASASHDSTAKLWNLKESNPRIGRENRPSQGLDSFKLRHTFTAHRDTVHAVAFNAHGSRLATASYDGRVGVFAVDSGEQVALFEAHAGKVGSVQFSSDGKQLLTSGNEDMSMRLWNLTTTPPVPAQAPLKSQDMLLWAALAPDACHAAAVGRDQTVTVYPLDGGAPLRLTGHEQTVYRAIFSPDGRQLATVSSDMTVRMWDLDSGKALFSLRLPTQMINNQSPLWDFDFRCTPDGACWIVVPLTVGKLALYRLGW